MHSCFCLYDNHNISKWKFLLRVHGHSWVYGKYGVSRNFSHCFLTLTNVFDQSFFSRNDFLFLPRQATARKMLSQLCTKAHSRFACQNFISNMSFILSKPCCISVSCRMINPLPNLRGILDKSLVACCLNLPCCVRIKASVIRHLALQKDLWRQLDIKIHPFVWHACIKAIVVGNHRPMEWLLKSIVSKHEWIRICRKIC